MKSIKRIVIAGAMVALVASACGKRDENRPPAGSESTSAPETIAVSETTAAPGTTAKRSGTQAFCSTVEDNLELLKEVDPSSSAEDIDQFVAVIKELAELAPDEVRDEAEALADALQPAGDAPEAEKEAQMEKVFDDKDIRDAAERFGKYVDDECDISLSGDTTGTTVKRSAGSAGTTRSPENGESSPPTTKM